MSVLINPITTNLTWQLYKRKTYPVYIQRVIKGKVYNVKDTPDTVYNFLEDSYEATSDADFVITGLLGEMWPIKKASLAGYDIADEEYIGEEPELFYSKSKMVYYATRIDAEKEFEIALENGIVLKGNRRGIEHEDGDYIVCTSFEKNDYRIVNGKIFKKMYERIKTDDGRRIER